ncbi:hypothetical protein [Thermomonospora umbrina]|uniref:Uncharacterized protein n=1 Tax=Thermomonospora umbrina TaxID=111806 RepID=A0A3D9SX91_9ACTN|nr:hypothetical protein [Thermomonospora umbrina]REE96221.1 hypothetical protein DFJ69_1649 [Thermomonospora umbrina]
MSSTLLYLAIVAVWAVVLVPMWLRRDNDGFSRLLAKRSDVTEDLTLDEPTLDVPTPDEPAREPEPTLTEPAHEAPADAPAHPAPRRPGRATVIARRRRRTFGLTLLLLASVTAVATGLAPWWTSLPATVLLAGHLALLRVAAGVDAARHRARTEAARAAAAAARAAEEARALAEPDPPTRKAEVIELVLGVYEDDEVFDQYADDRRAVGD